MSSPSMHPFKPKKTYQTTFTPALILSCLSGLAAPDAAAVRKRLAKWLIAQKSQNWSFNYWATSAPERTTTPYPDDLDATFCALIALRQHDPELISQDCLASTVKLLIATEKQVGGPYKTWLVPKNAPKIWQDIDLAVNSNIACFLSMIAEPLPNLTALVEKAIKYDKFLSPYYPSIYPLAYYITRAYTGAHTAELARCVLRRQRNGWWDSPLSTALAVSSLARLGEASQCKAAVQHLLDAQLPNGSWAAEGFSIDPSVQKTKYYSGAATLTTAFAVEALNLYEQADTPKPVNPKPELDKAAEALYSTIIKVATKELDDLGPELKKQTLTAIKYVQHRDKTGEISLLPYYFKNSLAIQDELQDTDTLTQLGLANLNGWIAYTIYDNFMDNEGDPLQLPAANRALRRSVKHFQTVKDESFQRLVEQTFDAIDSANSWELANCRMEVTESSIILGRLPNYRKTLTLADRSLGHTLTPLGVLSASGIKPTSQSAVLVRRSLRHYLVARQINDDLHDWEQDLQAGIITYVVAAILRELSLPPGKYSFAELIPKMQHQLWHNTLTGMCDVMQSHTSLARSAAKSCGLLAEPNIITRLTEKIDKSIDHTLAEQSKAKQFLASYREDKTPTPKVRTRSSPKTRSMQHR